MVKVTYLECYEDLGETFMSEYRDEAVHAFEEGAKVLETREYKIAFEKTLIEIKVTRSW